MATIGLVLLIAAFAASLAAAICLFAGGLRERAQLVRIGRIAVVVSFAALLLSCAILVFCFMTGDVSILYVLEERSLSTDPIAWLYRLAGLWAGRAGSLLFWTFLIALFNAVVLARSHFAKAKGAAKGGAKSAAKGAAKGVAKGGADPQGAARLDTIAMGAISVVVAVFAGVLLFSPGNMPFVATPDNYFAADGTLTAGAELHAMNQLLEHWAMAIHPPLLFVGYAGLTVPFAYAIAALVLRDFSKAWVERATRFVLISWVFLGAGIGLGAVWAYVVLGWGGYWGWDPVENASLLSWLVCVALVHTFTVYRQRGAFKRWAIMCACLAFTFVIVATFITRTGIVNSVHSFSGDPVSIVLFGLLIAVSIAVPLVLIIRRWHDFDAETEGADDVDNFLSKDAAYYFNNVIMIVFALLLTYMTVAPALPAPLPFAGASLGATAYEAIARPLGILYLLILAVCPLLAWGRTDPRAFLRQARIPAICAIVLFVLLMWWWATQLMPVYNATMAQGGTAAQTLLEAGPPVYYHALAVVGLLVASLLFFNALFQFVRNVKAPGKRAAAIGGGFAHIAMAIILVGLIGSNMYVYEQAGYLGNGQPPTYDDTTGQVMQSQAPETLEMREYRLEYAGDSIEDLTAESNSVIYHVDLDVYKDGALVGQVHPSVQLNVVTQQTKLNAGVLGFPEEDLFVVYYGVDYNGDYSLDVRVNPLITLVWVGFGMLLAGTLFAAVGRRRTRRAGTDSVGAGASSDAYPDSEGLGDESPRASSSQDA